MPSQANMRQARAKSLRQPCEARGGVRIPAGGAGASWGKISGLLQGCEVTA